MAAILQHLGLSSWRLAISPPTQVLDDLAIEVAARMGWPEGGASGMRAWLGLPDSGRSSRHYDLATVQSDLPPRQTHRSLVIATDYRSGSTLLAEGLAGAGGYGIPLEYLQRGAMERKFARFAAASQNGYLSSVMSRRTSPTGVFGIKLFWPEASAIYELPDPTIIWLRRGDVIAQAVSTWTALVTGVWRTSSSSEDDVPYDRARLIALVGMHWHHDTSWQRALAGLPVLDVTYERLSTDPIGVTEEIVAELGRRGMPSEDPVPKPRLARQASQRSRFLADQLVEDVLKGRWD